MEHIHGVDVSWMTHGSPKDRSVKSAPRDEPLLQLTNDVAFPPRPQPASVPPQPTSPHDAGPESATTQSATSTPGRPATGKSASEEKKPPPSGTSPMKKGSWFSNISSKFSSSGNGAAQNSLQVNNAPAEMSLPKASPAKNAVLQHATKHEGEGPYIPAPPRSSQTGLLQVLRRLSSTGSFSASRGASPSHGLVQRRILNVDHGRERCGIPGLNQAKLRRVAFCVDVEIAPMPKYVEPSPTKACSAKAGTEKDATQKNKLAMSEMDERAALEKPETFQCESETVGDMKRIGVQVPKEPPPTEGQGAVGQPNEFKAEAEGTSTEPPKGEAPTENRKKEKKKSEAERKTRKEKRKRLDQERGAIPAEIHLDSDSSTTTGTTPTHKTQYMPTTNPDRIYRRCCQLRETGILKRITEQLSNTANYSVQTGVVERLDLTNYPMEFADIVTLGDYLAIVPVKEVVLENCGLTDEGLRVILAGLLAAKKSERGRQNKPTTGADGFTHQGGFVERLVLKKNKMGPEGWKYLCLFIYLCRTLTGLDLTGIPFCQVQANNDPQAGKATKEANETVDLCGLLSKSIGDRLGGSTLNLINLGETGLSTLQLSIMIDAVIKCGVKRLGLSSNEIGASGMEHIARYLKSGICDGLDLGGNDLRDRLDGLADALNSQHPLWALSLAECSLVPSSLCKLFPKLVSLNRIRFIDLSHNHDLFESNPSAVALLRRYLPEMKCLKRLHLADCALTAEQTIALAEVLPEITHLAHINLLENSALVALTNAHTEESREEACAVFASLLAAARISKSLVAIDIEVPSEHSGDLVQALAKQVVAYCLRNMERMPVSEPGAATVAQTEASSKQGQQYPDVLQHLLGHDVLKPAEPDDDAETGPDEDYVIGGTGVVKALACCLNNRGDEFGRQSSELVRDVDEPTDGEVSGPRLAYGKAKDTSKHLLMSARKIRQRLQPVIVRTMANRSGDVHAYHRLLFLDNTLSGIIKRFEDEFPDTRESIDDAMFVGPAEQKLGRSPSAAEDVEGCCQMVHSDAEEEADLSIKPPAHTRPDSVISTTSKALANEEGRVFRASHTFKEGYLKPEMYMYLQPGVDAIAENLSHVRLLHEMLDDVKDEALNKLAEKEGVVKVFKEHRDEIVARLKALDPDYWETFMRSQDIARANIRVGDDLISPPPLSAPPLPQLPQVKDGMSAADEEKMVDEIQVANVSGIKS